VESKNEPIQGAGPGLGWSLPVIEITNDSVSGMYSPDGPGCPDGCGSYSPYGHSLILNGTSYRLLPYSGSQRAGLYKAMGDPSIRVELIHDLGAPNRTGEYWKVQTADGTTYQLGYYDESELAVGAVAAIQNQGQPRNHNFAAFSWKVDTIADKYGRQIRYFYDEICGAYNTPGTCRNEYDQPTTIEATTSTGEPPRR
jgi:hypothetical protein